MCPTLTTTHVMRHLTLSIGLEFESLFHCFCFLVNFGKQTSKWRQSYYMLIYSSSPYLFNQHFISLLYPWESQKLQNLSLGIQSHFNLKMFGKPFCFSLQMLKQPYYPFQESGTLAECERVFQSFASVFLLSNIA